VTEAVITWVLLTQGDRPESLDAALDSVTAQSGGHPAVVVINTESSYDLDRHDVELVRPRQNLGIPGGRDLGLSGTTTELIGFLDDDARLVRTDTSRLIADLFEREPELGVVSLRLIDADGATARRHVPRIGRHGVDRSGDVGTFLGGACVVRRAAYDAAGGYWPALFYAHEELDLAWRVIDAGYRVRYLAEHPVEHPKAPISRHGRGWSLTGRNRVMIARRNLPWPIALPHVAFWLTVGLLRAPDRACRSAYARGWMAGWTEDVPRSPIRWRTIWALTRLGRPPIL
jgi:GT2 family glycosyltransferase